jgi:methylmalonyl-CoA mutase C-terminal domain/subunit
LPSIRPVPVVKDIDSLKEQGVGELFGPGTRTTDLIDYIRQWFESKQKQSA